MGQVDELYALGTVFQAKLPLNLHQSIIGSGHIINRWLYDRLFSFIWLKLQKGLDTINMTEKDKRSRPSIFSASSFIYKHTLAKGITLT